MISERGRARDVVRSASQLKWRALLAIALLWIATLTGQVWVLAILFILWAITDILTGETHLLEVVRRRENPIVFWTIVLSWIALSALWIVYV